MTQSHLPTDNSQEYDHILYSNHDDTTEMMPSEWEENNQSVFTINGRRLSIQEVMYHKTIASQCEGVIRQLTEETNY
ncbi:hypothetical protein K7432_017249 [Basidiobolus ranarum]|uniref:Uncharacterized protein n=1 Tax=Basidiobolus ranarum TaxID=34480 RepID=A0ABR2WDM6_9FUNG